MKKRQRKKGVRRRGGTGWRVRPEVVSVPIGFVNMIGVIEGRAGVVNGEWREEWRRLPDRGAAGPSDARPS